MKNKEKFAKEILDIACNGRRVAMDTNTKRLCMCIIDCADCYFSKYNYPHNQGDCKKNLAHWANSEYKEKKEFSEMDKAYVKAMDGLNWFVKDKNGMVYGCVAKPFKSACMWGVKPVGDENEWEKVSGFTSATFEPLSWDDEEPVHRSEILGG